jgi:hypothetical protein
LLCSPNVFLSPECAVYAEVEDLRAERLRTVCDDMGAVIQFLRFVVQIVPDFTVYRNRIHSSHGMSTSIKTGPFIAHAARVPIEAKRVG